jgi:hypothetical protein
MKRKIPNKPLLLLLLFVSLQSCAQINNGKMETYDQFRTQQIERRDSLFISYTVKEWGKKKWYSWAVRTDMYKMTFEDVHYFIAGTFYSPDKKIILAWVGAKMPNAAATESYSEKPELNKLCPDGADTIYTLSVLIGYRDSVNDTWKMFPFDQKAAGCFDSKDKVINVLGQYYFGQMKTHQMYRMVQNGRRKGHLELEAYGYNLQDKDFWDKCWLFQKDTVGSYGLYPFQIKGYNYNGDKCTRECAEPYKPPIVDYPEEILKLYK